MTKRFFTVALGLLLVLALAVPAMANHGLFNDQPDFDQDGVESPWENDHSDKVSWFHDEVGCLEGYRNTNNFAGFELVNRNQAVRFFDCYNNYREAEAQTPWEAKEERLTLVAGQPQSVDAVCSTGTATAGGFELSAGGQDFKVLHNGPVLVNSNDDNEFHSDTWRITVRGEGTGNVKSYVNCS